MAEETGAGGEFSNFGSMNLEECSVELTVANDELSTIVGRIAGIVASLESAALVLEALGFENKARLTTGAREELERAQDSIVALSTQFNTASSAILAARAANGGS